ncbi:MAG: YdeI/OmpD-associated family protein [Anaerolineae bacterium]
MTTLETIYMENFTNWRLWLQAHHQTSPGVWLLFFKVSSGQPCITYDDALDEALCYGWIDSIIKKLDEERYLRKFTPRTNTANWSTANKQRVLKLIAQGRMQAEGLSKIEDINALNEQPTQTRPTLPELPNEIVEAIQANANAWAFWQTLAQTHRREYIWWLTSAKRPETVARRLGEALALLEQQRLLGLK